MSVSLVFRIAAIGILVSVLSQVLTRAGLVVVLLMVVNLIGEFFTSVQAIFNLY